MDPCFRRQGVPALKSGRSCIKDWLPGTAANTAKALSPISDASVANQSTKRLILK
jgi:hypothetical protein